MGGIHQQHRPRQDLPLRSTIALQFICDDDPWDVLTPFEQLAEELLRGLFVAPVLHQNPAQIFDTICEALRGT